MKQQVKVLGLVGGTAIGILLINLYPRLSFFHPSPTLTANYQQLPKLENSALAVEPAAGQFLENLETLGGDTKSILPLLPLGAQQSLEKPATTSNQNTQPIYPFLPIPIPLVSLEKFIPWNLVTLRGPDTTQQFLDRGRQQPHKSVLAHSVVPHPLPLRRSSFAVPQQPQSRLIVSLRKAKVYVQRGEQVVAIYPVAVGKAGHPTPTGVFQITDMQQNPTWQNPYTGEIVPPSPSNPIGDRWIEFIRLPNGSRIGFHGTNQEASVGQAVSDGCLRMRKADLHRLFAQAKIGTSVVVRN